jgi:hypothetical protein
MIAAETVETNVRRKPYITAWCARRRAALGSFPSYAHPSSAPVWCRSVEACPMVRSHALPSSRARKGPCVSRQ